MNIEDFKIFKSIPSLKTDRLTLRKITKKDLDDIFEYSQDPEVSKHLMWYPHPTRSVSRSYLSGVIKRYKSGSFYDWAIEYENKMIGTVGFSKIDVLNDTAEIGYVLNRDFWGRGFAAEAAKEVIRFGFDVLKLRRIDAVCMVENAQSLAVMKKCGMTPSDEKREPISKDGKTHKLSVSSIFSPDI